MIAARYGPGIVVEISGRTLKHVVYSGLQNCCNVWPFSTGLNVALNRVGIVLRVG